MSTGGGPRGRGVGRGHELAAAAFARDTARAGAGSVLAVVGPPGSGKTWLCEAVAEAAVGEGFQVGWGTGWNDDRAVPPLWPWQQALGPFLDRDDTAALLGPLPDDLDDPGWFTRCLAVVERLRRLSTDQPLLLVIDDVHHADPPTRRLARFVARHLRGLPLLLVLAYDEQEGAETGGDDLAALGREASVVPLHGLDRADVAALLAARGVRDLGGADLDFLAVASGGRPGTLHHLVNTAPAAGAGGVVAALVDLRLAELPPDVRRAAAHAAVADAAPRLAEMSAVAPDVRIDPAVVAADLERRGLIADRGASGFTFAHERVRSALVATLDPLEVLDVHARVAGLLATPPASLDRRRRRAEHALAAAGRSPADAALALQAVHDVAGDLIAASRPQQAADLLAEAEAAHRSAGLGSPRAGLLATRGVALQRAGLLAAARDQFRLAAAAADEEGDPENLARAALGLGGVWLVEERSPIDRERFLALQRRARRGLPPEATALRLRLDARYAAEDAYATGDLAAIESAVDAARAHGDPALLAEALSLYHHAILGPAHRDRRAAVCEEMLAVSARAGDDWLALMALLWLTTDQVLEGNPRAEQTLRELHERADAVPGRHAAYIARVMDVMLLQRAGRLAEAEEAAATAYAIGTEVGDADALAYYGGQLVVLRWLQGRPEEVLDLADETAASPTITPLNQAFTATQASLAAAAGDHDRARAALRRLQGRLPSLHQSSAWLVTLFSVVEAAHLLGDAAMATEAASLMAPYADLPVVGSLGVSCLGSVRRSLGLAAVTAGDHEEGVRQLEQAVADDERLGNRPLATITTADLATARLARAAPGDVDAAAALLDDALRAAEAMGLDRRAERWRALRSTLATGPGPGPASALPPPVPAGPVGGGVSGGVDTEADARPVAEVGVVEASGRSWRLRAGGREAVVPDLLGMGYLVQLLTNPGIEIPAVDLVDNGTEPAPGHDRSDQPVLDHEALAAYRHRVAELEDDLDEAERHADPERAARARAELDAVVDELTRSTGQFGRSRRFSSSAERARTAVQKAVRRALDQIERAEPELGAVLRLSVRTGRTCCYEPAPGAPARWHRRQAPAAAR